MSKKLIDPTEQEIKLSFEHQDYKWISHDAEIELYLNSEIKQTVMMSLSKYSNFVFMPFLTNHSAVSINAFGIAKILSSSILQIPPR